MDNYSYKLMKTHFVLMSLAIYSSYTACPSIIINPVYSASICNFQFQSSSGTCSFSKCLFKSTAIDKTTQTEGYSECYSYCCSSISDKIDASSDPVAILEQCQSINQQMENLLIGLTVGLTFSAIALFVLIFCCCRRQQCPLYKLKKKVFKDQDEVQVQPNSEQFQIKDPAYKQVKTEKKDNKQDSSKNIKDEIPKNVKLLLAKCWICHSKKPYTKLVCGHYFHINCIRKHFDKMDNCPVCKSAQQQSILIYCQNCQRQVNVVSAENLSDYYKNGDMICQTCKTQK